MIFSPQLEPFVRNCILDLQSEGKTEFSTIELIDKYLGRYYVDHAPPNKSWNANLGKYLSDSADDLGIENIGKHRHDQDDNSEKTHTADWRII
jgi:hypothetical protein